MEALDLMQYGLPIKIHAPDEAKVTFEDYGFMKDVTVKGRENYFVQIRSGDATTTDIANIKSKLLSEAKEASFFSKVIEESDQGFIYEKNLGKDKATGADNLNYDFRYVKIQGDQEYIFQRGLIGRFTLDEVKNMYLSVQ